MTTRYELARSSKSILMWRHIGTRTAFLGTCHIGDAIMQGTRSEYRVYRVFITDLTRASGNHEITGHTTRGLIAALRMIRRSAVAEPEDVARLEREGWAS